MRRHRIYMAQLKSGEVQLAGAEAHHLIKVLRVQPSQPVTAFDGKGLEAQGVIEQIEGGQVTLLLDAVQESQVESSWQLSLAVSLLKADKMSTIIRQGTELGVKQFIPVLSHHCDVRTVSSNKVKRWERIAQEASKQSGRSVVPKIMPLTMIAELEAKQMNIVAHPYSATRLQDVLVNMASEAEFLLLTGPEGGFAAGELELLEAKGFHSVVLGPRILRAETAPLALCAALLLPEAR